MLKKILAIGLACVLFCGYIGYVVVKGNDVVSNAADSVVACATIGH